LLKVALKPQKIKTKQKSNQPIWNSAIEQLRLTPGW
jgi:hypothetical protein